MRLRLPRHRFASRSPSAGVSIVNPLVRESLNVPGITQTPVNGDLEFSCFALRAPIRRHNMQSEGYTAACR